MALYTGSVTATTTAAALNSGTSQLVKSVYVQNDPTSTVAILVGNSAGQNLRLRAGEGAALPVDNPGNIYVKSASSTATVNWIASDTEGVFELAVNPMTTDGVTGLFSDGSAATPGVAFSADTNTGLYRIAADTLGTSVGGAEVDRATTTATTLVDDRLLRLGSDGDQVLLNRSTSLNTNTTLASAILGTPVTPAIAANSLIVSNVTASGDILFAANNGGNSQAWFWVDSSAGLAQLLGAGTAVLEYSATAIEVKDDILFTFGTDGDGVALNRSASLNANTALTGALVGTPASAATPANSLLVSNVTADGDIAFFTRNAAGADSIEGLRLDASAGLIVLNEASADWDVRVEGANNANMVVVDGGTDSLALGSAVVAGAFASIDGASVNRDGVTAVGRQVHVPAATITQTNANPTTLAIGAAILLGTPTFAGANGSQTISDAANLYIAAAAAQGTNMTLTRNYALFVDAGTSRFDGTVQLGLAGDVKGVLNFQGNTSGVVTIQPLAAAGTYTLTLPPDDGDAGEQLQSDGTGVMTWEAAGSLRSVKNVLGRLDPREALDRIVRAPVSNFTYKAKGRPTTGDYQTVYAGVMADEAPWAMHHGGRIFSPVSAFGHTAAAIQALVGRVQKLEQAAGI